MESVESFGLIILCMKDILEKDCKMDMVDKFIKMEHIMKVCLKMEKKMAKQLSILCAKTVSRVSSKEVYILADLDLFIMIFPIKILSNNIQI